ncbi:MAG: hypothetical protein R3F11_07520 [Verrucomicrobiales bacterium]
MRLLALICLTLSGAAALAGGSWSLHVGENGASIAYRPAASDDPGLDLEGLEKALAGRDAAIPIKHISLIGGFEAIPAIQAELKAQFEADYPDLLAAALKSSGNMHNPKVLPLRAKFPECFLKTPSVKKINKVLAAHGCAITGISFEKFYIDKADPKAPAFHAFLWLKVGPPGEGKAAD